MTDYVSMKEEGKGLASMKTAFTHRYNDSKTIYKNMEDSLQPSETIMITRWTTEGE